MITFSPTLIYFICFGVIGSVLYFIMMMILSNQKEFDNSTISPIRVISDFWSLLKKEQNLKLKRKYKVLFWIEIALIPAYMIGGFFMLVLS